MSGELNLTELFLHGAAVIVGLGAAALLVMAYRKFGEGEMSEFVRFTTFGIVVLSLVHVFEDAAIFITALEPFEHVLEHLAAIIGFALIGFGAWNLYKFSSLTGTK